MALKRDVLRQSAYPERRDDVITALEREIWDLKSIYF
jgi:hypothetical protein